MAVQSLLVAAKILSRHSSGGVPGVFQQERLKGVVFLYRADHDRNNSVN